MSLSLSRSPSPLRGGGWSSPGLTSPFDNTSGRSSPRKAYDVHANAGISAQSSVTWATAKAKSEQVHSGYPSFSTRGQGFFQRHARKISESLPKWGANHVGGENGTYKDKDYAEKEKLGRGRWRPGKNGITGLMGALRTYVGSIGRRMKLRVLIGLVLVLGFVLFWTTREFSLPDSVICGLFG